LAEMHAVDLHEVCCSFTQHFCIVHVMMYASLFS
jgi:hypothetical protein